MARSIQVFRVFVNTRCADSDNCNRYHPDDVMKPRFEIRAAGGKHHVSFWLLADAEIAPRNARFREIAGSRNLGLRGSL